MVLLEDHFALTSFRPFVIGGYNASHKLMPNHIPVSEVDKANSRNILENLDGIYKSRGLVIRQVYLACIPCNDHLRLWAHASKKHFDLHGSGVLCLI